MIRDLPRNLLATLAILFSMLFAVPAMAGLVGTEQLAQDLSVESERDRLKVELARPEAVKKLESMGVDPARAAERVNALTDQEVREMVAKLDAMPAGGALSDTALVLLLILLIVLLI